MKRKLIRFLAILMVMASMFNMVALAAEPDLLLLDEPCLNLDAASARRLRRTVSAWLARRPSCTALCIAHRPDDVPAGFDHVMRLDAAPAGAVYAKVAKSFVAQQCS